MILDSIDHWRLYTLGHSRLERAFRFLVDEWNSELPDERIDVDGDNVFALPQGYATRPLGKCRFEAHRRYIDIQYVIAGAEEMGWAPISTLAVSQPYKDEKDVEFYHLPAAFQTVVVPTGWFTVFHPSDGHLPCLRTPTAEQVRKVVMKIRV